MSKKEQPQKTEMPDFAARRRLLKLGVYAPPAILGMMMGQKSAWAEGRHRGQRPSCKPAACNPCVTKNEHEHGSSEYEKKDFECRKYRSRYRDRD